MIAPTPSDIGRLVIYRDRFGSKVEVGTITSFDERWVWVCYGRPGTTSAATSPAQLEWAPRDVA